MQTVLVAAYDICKHGYIIKSYEYDGSNLIRLTDLIFLAEQTLAYTEVGEAFEELFESVYCKHPDLNRYNAILNSTTLPMYTNLVGLVGEFELLRRQQRETAAAALTR